MKIKKDLKKEIAPKKEIQKKYRFMDSKYGKEEYDFLEKHFRILKKKYKTKGAIVVKMLEFYEKNVLPQKKTEK